MARPRLRVRRLFWLAVLFVLLLLLFEMNRFLPGGWPGGGGDGGFRTLATVGPDPSRVRPPDADPPPWPEEGIRVTFRSATGESISVWRLAVGEEEASETAGPDGARLDDASVLRDGFRVESGESVLRHGPAHPDVAPEWVVYAPADPAPSAGPPRPPRLRVVAAESRQPLPGAAVDYAVAGRPRTVRTSARGEVELEGASGLVRASVTAAGRQIVSVTVHDRQEATLEVRVPLLMTMRTRFLDAVDGRPTDVERLGLRSRDGRLLHDFETGGGMPLLTEGVPDDALLEVGGGDRPVYQVPLAEVGAELRLPRGRLVEVRATDHAGRDLPGVRLTARYDGVPPAGTTATEVGPEPLQVLASAADRIPVPDGSEAAVLVEAEGAAPAVLHVGVDYPPGIRTITLEEGVTLEVAVVDESQRPLEGARVIVVAAPGRFRVEREATTDAGGRAVLGDLPQGPVEVYAHAPGRAWARATVVAGAGESPRLVLEEGAVLRLVVESPLGVPLEGVRVVATPEDDGLPDVVPPAARPWRTDERGILVVEDLRRRAYRLRLSRPGHADATLRRVRPGPVVHFATLIPESE
ncbi:MAG: carboxypeptidase regulatory-like domain-containing protein [Planctomycetota bacterium]|jgi:hypothetical protein